MTASAPLRARAADLAHLSRAELEAIVEAGLELQEIARLLAKTGHNVVLEALGEGSTVYLWEHYPKGDVYDPETHAQFFYHAHEGETRPGEHGHFHLFLRPRGMPPGLMPLVLPEDAVAGAAPAVSAPIAQPNQGPANDGPCHLVAIAMSEAGEPCRLFATNRWVTGETWYRAEDVMRMLPAFRIDLAKPSWPLNRWIGAAVTALAPDIRNLLDARDNAIIRWRSRRSGSAPVFEDRRLEVVAELPIDLAAYLRRAGKALRRAA